MTPKTSFPVVVVTGLSGSGKSTALRVFEDIGFFCVDGLPASMVPKLAMFFQSKDSSHRGLVLGMDLRQHDFVDEWNEAVKELNEQGMRPRIVYLEARLDTLFRRYAATRRPHPLESANLGLEQALEEERKLLSSIRNDAELIIDTTEYSIHDLRRTIQDKWVRLDKEPSGLRIHVISFGFKYGVPIDADLIFDLRFLPNPYFEPSLRPMSGKDAPVAEYVFANDPGDTFKVKFIEFLLYLLPLYAAEGRYRVTLGLGCTGGRHRSVAVSEFVSKALQKEHYSVTLEHRHFELG